MKLITLEASTSFQVVHSHPVRHRKSGGLEDNLIRETTGVQGDERREIDVHRFRPWREMQKVFV
jgi:hypothetical protein